MKRFTPLVFAIALAAPTLHAAELRVALTPPHDPDGLLWKIELRSADPDALLGEYGTAVDGTWSRRGLAPKSRVILVVKTDSGQPWWNSPEPITLEEDVTEEKIALGLVRVAGTLTWGGGPIAALLKFEDARVGTRVEVRADREGTFKVGLPRLGDWNVTVTGKRPPVNQTVRADIAEDHDGVVRTAIALESGCICGEVVDMEGHPIPSARVRLRAMGRDVNEELETDGDGIFGAYRLPPGRYRISAESRERTTPVFSLDLQPRIGAPWTSLVAAKMAILRGHVVDEAGRPLRGVLLVPVPAPGVAPGPEESGFSKRDGSFELRVFPGLEERCLGLAHPGRGSDVVRVKANGDDQVVPLDTRSWGYLGAGLGKWLVRNGCAIPVAALPVHREPNSSGAYARLTPGEWTICQDRVQVEKGPPFVGCWPLVLPPLAR